MQNEGKEVIKEINDVTNSENKENVGIRGPAGTENADEKAVEKPEGVEKAEKYNLFGCEVEPNAIDESSLGFKIDLACLKGTARLECWQGRQGSGATSSNIPCFKRGDLTVLETALEV